jgi:hypothetical protein
MAGVPVTDVVPETWMVQEPGLLTLVAELDGEELLLTCDVEAALAASEKLFLAWTRNQPVMRKPQAADFLNVNIVAQEAFADGADVGPQYILRTGGVPPVLDSVLWVKCQIIDSVSGCVSSPVYGSVQVVAPAP